MKNYICIHAHFYQPPRENPWLEAIERQKSAHPYHDWNQRIAAECYQPNGMARVLDSNGCIDRILNNYSRVSFNFGPTLLSWLASEDPETYDRIIEADQESRGRFSGHGCAIAQAYNHPILPLCNRRDKATQIGWGVRDFSRRFRRSPESMWLPETAADLETLDLMAQAGMRYAILAPHQARRTRKKTDRAWKDVDGSGIDCTMPYELHLPSGKTIAVFFYNGPISRAVGFENLLSNGEAFLGRLMAAFLPDRQDPQLVHIATDGETYGHHHKFGEMALAYALNRLETGGLAQLTNYGLFLEMRPPTHVVEIWENTSWSCAHGVARWAENCGCSTGTFPGGMQQWRAPLRQALDRLRDTLGEIYVAEAEKMLKDPWAARDDYIDVILDRSQQSVDRFLATHGIRPLTPEERVRVLKLQEMQRNAMLMYTSCGWFFDDLSRIETVQILQFAGRAIELAEDLSGRRGIEEDFLTVLQEARSNDPEFGNGRDVYRKLVRPAMVAKHRLAGHYAVRTVIDDMPERCDFYSSTVERLFCRTVTSERAGLAVGHCRMTSKITGEVSYAEYAVVHLGGGNISGKAKDCGEEPDIVPGIAEEITHAFEKNDIPAVFRIMDRHFGLTAFSLDSLFLDERLHVLEALLKESFVELQSAATSSYNRTAPIVRALLKHGVDRSPSFRCIAEWVLHSRLLAALQSDPINTEDVIQLWGELGFWRGQVDKGQLEDALRQAIEKKAKEARDRPGDLQALRAFSAAVDLASRLAFDVNYYRTQTLYYELLRKGYPRLREAAEKGDAAAALWVAEFLELGRKLCMRLDGSSVLCATHPY